MAVEEATDGPEYRSEEKDAAEGENIAGVVSHDMVPGVEDGRPVDVGECGEEQELNEFADEHGK